MILIAYVSTSTATEVTPEILGSILEASDRNNARNDVTGALLVSGNRFFQVLEGKAEAVNKTLKRIGDDPRHKDVKQVWAGQSSGRMFDGWAMVAVAADPENRINISRTIDEAVDYPAAAISTLLKLVNRQRR